MTEHPRTCYTTIWFRAMQKWAHTGVHCSGNSHWQRGRSTRDNWELNDDGRVDKGLQCKDFPVWTPERGQCVDDHGFRQENDAVPAPWGQAEPSQLSTEVKNTEIRSFFIFLPCLIFSWERTSWLFHSLFVQFVLSGVFCTPPVTACSAQTHTDNLKVMLSSLFGWFADSERTLTPLTNEGALVTLQLLKSSLVDTTLAKFTL